MSDRPRLGVLFTPSPLAPLWRRALAARACEMGWSVVDADTPVADGPDAGEATVLLLCHDLIWLDGVRPADCVVLMDTPDAALAMQAMASNEDTPSSHSRWLVSARLAAACGLAGSGAVVLDARRDTLVLPGLGEVRRDAHDGPEAASSGGRPLAMYDVLPCPAGAAASWPPSLFTYPLGAAFEGGSPLLDMTGRARPVLFGPFVELTPGVWRVEIEVAVDPEGSPALLLFEWGAGALFVSCKAEVAAPGLYSVALDRVWSAGEAAQARLWIAQPLFQGRMEFMGCRVTRMPDDTPETSSTEPAPSTPPDDD